MVVQTDCYFIPLKHENWANLVIKLTKSRSGRFWKELDWRDKVGLCNDWLRLMSDQPLRLASLNFPYSTALYFESFLRRCNIVQRYALSVEVHILPLDSKLHPSPFRDNNHLYGVFVEFKVLLTWFRITCLWSDTKMIYLVWFLLLEQPCY